MLDQRKSAKVSNIPIFILAGGLGTRLSEETQTKPKPMLEIGDVPILIHIMRSYYACGFDDFVICAGYKAFEIKRYFLEYHHRLNDLEVDSRERVPENAQRRSIDTPYRSRAFGKTHEEERWRVRVVDTGLEAMTGARVVRAFDKLVQMGQDDFKEFGLTYGDGLCDVDLAAELEFHRAHGATGTVLGVKNLARYGELDVAGDSVHGFLEKPEHRQGFISGGFFFFNRNFRDYLSTREDLVLEREPLSELARDGQLKAFKHTGFWHAMDTLRDKNHLQALWESGKAPWLRRSQNEIGNDIHHGRDGITRRRAG